MPGKRAPGQKAPSAKRCIKTDRDRRLHRVDGSVRKHQAQKGALRSNNLAYDLSCGRLVRKHQAPKGALRRDFATIESEEVVEVRTHQASKGALRRTKEAVKLRTVFRQKAPSAIRRIKTIEIGCLANDGVDESERTEHQKVH